MLLEGGIGMVVGSAAVTTRGAREGCIGAARIDNNCLSLGRCPAPQINVMAAVSLVQCCNLIGSLLRLEVPVPSRLMHVVRNQRDRYEILLLLLLGIGLGRRTIIDDW